MSSVQHILIIGLGISGFDAARLALAKGYQVTILDAHDNETLRQRQALLSDATIYLNANFEQGYPHDILVTSPGIPPLSTAGKFISRQNTPLLSEIEFAAQFTDTPLIGITGTNGKTTTCELATHCANELAFKTVAAGNIGRTLSSVVLEEDVDLIVLELSSFQLEHCESLKLHAAAFLNFSSDHAERYESEQAYFDAKASIFMRCEKGNGVYSKGLSQKLNKYFAEQELSGPGNSLQLVTKDPRKAEQELSGPGKSFSSSSNESDCQLIDEHLLLSGESYSLENFPLKGHHNIENLMAVMLLLKTLPQLKNSAKAIIEASSSFVLAPHRCEHFLAEFGCFVNDSKATNPDATNRAIGSLAKQYSGKLRLILGGRDKEMDFTLMQDQVLKHCKELYLYGEARETLADIFEKKVKCQLIEGFSEATTQALQDLQKNEALLLSPACASQDQFKSYGERGDLFKDLVRKFYH